MIDKKNYIHKKIAAEELMRYIKKDRVYYIVVIICSILLAGLHDNAIIIRMSIGIALIVFMGLQLIFDLKTQKRLNEEYIYPRVGDVKVV